jgi:hypothetical protein
LTFNRTTGYVPLMFTAPEKLTSRIGVRLSAHERAQLEVVAQRHRIALSEAARQAIAHALALDAEKRQRRVRRLVKVRR